MFRRPVDAHVLVAGVGGAAALTAGAAAHRMIRRQIVSDPQAEMLRLPARGTPGHAVSADGTELHVETFGPPAGPVVVLIHGWTETIAYWTPVLRELESRGIRAIAYDLRGHGQSQRAAGGDYAMARFGEDVEAVLEAFVGPSERAVVVGHSLGAMSIAAWAEHHDVRCRAGGALLLNTGVGGLVNESLLVPVPAAAQAVNRTVAVHGFLGARAPLPRFSTPISHHLIRYAAFGPRAGAAQVAFFERMLVSCPPDVRADIGIAMSEMELHHALKRLAVPTALIAGSCDRLTPPTHARRIASMLPDLAGLTVLEGIGHMAPLEAPHAVVEKVVELVETCALAGAVAV